jgi:hypothetical protein
MPIEDDQLALEPVLSHKLTVTAIEDPVEGHIAFKEPGLSRVKDFLRIEALDRLSIDYRLTPIARGRLSLTGKIEAQLTQLCVVTREPVAESIDEPLSLECWPEEQMGEVPEIDHDASEDAMPEDPPVPIIAGKVDLGALAVELVASAMNPYPRSDGAAFDWQDPQGDPAASGPFADLAKLKPKT